MRCSDFIGWIWYFIFICTYCKLCKHLYFYKKKRLYWPNFVWSSESRISKVSFILSVEWEKIINTLMLFVKKDDWDFFLIEFISVPFHHRPCDTINSNSSLTKGQALSHFLFLFPFLHVLHVLNHYLLFIAATKYQKYKYTWKKKMTGKPP